MIHFEERLLTLQAASQLTFDRVMNEFMLHWNEEMAPITHEVIEKVYFDGDACELFSVKLKQKSLQIEAGDYGAIAIKGIQGRLCSGDREMPVYDIVIALKKNNLAQCFKFAEYLSKHHGLLIEARSIDERGLRLAGVRPQKQSMSVFQAERHNQNATGVFRSVLMGYLVEIADCQATYLDRSDDSENLHRLRVKIRQMRSILSLFRPLLNKDKYLVIGDCARKLEQALGRMRELDVLLMEWTAMQLELTGGNEAASEMTKLLMLEKDKEDRLVYGDLSSGLSTPMLLSIGSWLYEKDCFKERTRKITLKRYLDKRLMKWELKIKSGQRRIAAMDFEEIHAFRIRCKKMRYGLECFTELFSEDRTVQQVSKLKKMQTLLGTLCDTQRNIALLEQILSKGANDEIREVQSLFNTSQMERYNRLLKSASLSDGTFP